MNTSPPVDSRKALHVHHLLLDFYGAPEIKEQRGPLDELVLTILSQNTNDVNSGRAYEQLRHRFGSWQEVLEADPQEVTKAIRVAGLAETKAPRIQAILRDLQRERGELSLEFLRALPVAEARSYLLGMHGVGPKTASCVLLFSLHKPALPVDTHVHRVSLRLGLVPAKTTPERAALLLEALLPEDTYYPFHLNVILHGRTLCKAGSPRCDICPLAQDCQYYGNLIAQRTAASAPTDDSLLSQS
ncbi:MAG: endonuclease III domain-containing protein [Anaerolineae bacterium]